MAISGAILDAKDKMQDARTCLVDALEDLNSQDPAVKCACLIAALDAQEKAIDYANKAYTALILYP